MNPSESRLQPLRFRLLIRNGRWPPHPRTRVSSTGQQIFKNMPTLLPRESMSATSVIPAPTQRPSPSDHRVGFSSTFTRLLIGSLALRPALLLFGNSRPRVTATPLPHATGAYGQLPGRDFNPLDLLLLLRTVRSHFVARPLAACRTFQARNPDWTNISQSCSRRSCRKVLRYSFCRFIHVRTRLRIKSDRLLDILLTG